MKNYLFAIMLTAILVPVAARAFSPGTLPGFTTTPQNGATTTTPQNGTPTVTTPQNGTDAKTIEIPNLLKCSAPGKSDLECLIDRIFSFLWYLAFPLVSLMVLVGAYQLMTSQGNEEKVSAGRKTITWAVIGFVVLILARSVAYIITNLLSSLGK